MEMDMREKQKAREERAHKAMRFKEEGNRAMAGGEFVKAIELYQATHQNSIEMQSWEA